jgi:predicted CXXCH cytochrome family protein
MNTKMINISRLVRMMVASALLLGAFGISQQAVAGITSTKHNLGSGNTDGGNHVTAGTGEICVFCHTPHAADTSAPVPLWNKKLPAGGGFTTYASLNSSTIDGQILAAGSISLACLSCHDGTQAMDNIINAPGSGGYDASGGGATGLGWTWAGARVDADGKMTNTATSLAMLGTDLQNDHPIGIEYCGGGISGTTNVTGCKDIDFQGGTSGGGKLATASINANRVWWVDTSVGTDGTREKTDMILYTRTFTAGAGPSVECASCHDPHTSANPTFLRVSNTTIASGVCLSCHVK